MDIATEASFPLTIESDSQVQEKTNKKTTKLSWRLNSYKPSNILPVDSEFYRQKIEWFGELVREKRLSLEMTQEDLAIKLGVSDGTISNFENMKETSIDPKICFLCSLAKVLNLEDEVRDLIEAMLL